MNKCARLRWGTLRPSLWLTSEAWFTLLACMILLRLFGFRRTCDRLAPRRRTQAPAGSGTDLGEIGRAVFRAARLAPGLTSCLIRSLVLWRMLVVRGTQATIHFGVRPNGAAWELHAWVQCGKQVINDRPDVAQSFRPLLPANPDRLQSGGLNLG